MLRDIGRSNQRGWLCCCSSTRRRATFEKWEKSMILDWALEICILHMDFRSEKCSALASFHNLKRQKSRCLETLKHSSLLVTSDSAWLRFTIRSNSYFPIRSSKGYFSWMEKWATEYLKRRLSASCGLTPKDTDGCRSRIPGTAGLHNFERKNSKWQENFMRRSSAIACINATTRDYWINIMDGL